jgi:hypothetical protein
MTAVLAQSGQKGWFRIACPSTITVAATPATTAPVAIQNQPRL